MERKRLLKKFAEAEIPMQVSHLENLPPSLEPYTVKRKSYILARLGRYQEAIDVLDLALSVGPVSVDNLNLKATILELTDRLGEAQLTFNQILYSKEDYSDAYVGRAVVLRKQKNYQQALEDINRAI